MIGDKPDFYLIGDMPMCWWDRQRIPKLIKFFAVFPFAVCCLPWMLFWNILDTIRDEWRNT